MATIGELVEKKRLFHQFKHHAIHISLDQTLDGEDQSQVQKWRKEKVIGAGAFGTVPLEVLERQLTSRDGQPTKSEFRAVKEASKTGVKGQVYKRELEAIVNFFQKKV